MRRILECEKLEERTVLSAGSFVAIDGSELIALDDRGTVTTTVPPADAASPTGVGHDGVVMVSIDKSTIGYTDFCSGALLSTGRHILTAAHCFAEDPGLSFNVSGNVATALEVRFETEGGVTVIPVNPSSVTVHPSYRTVLGGNDIAIIELPVVAPQDADRYDIYTGGDEVGSIIEIVGYGAGGQGAIDDSLPNSDAVDPTLGDRGGGFRRSGLNRYDFLSLPNNPGTPLESPGTLRMDFDSGLPQDDTIGNYFGIVDLGLGSDEAVPVPGDSGGPQFIDGRIAGISSTQGGVTVPAGSYGAIPGATPTSAFVSWIDSYTVDTLTASAPRIASVVVSGANALDGSGGQYALPAGGGGQLASAPIGGLDTIRIEFDQPVVADANDIQLIGTGRAVVVDPAANGFALASDGLSATWTFDTASGGLVDDTYIIKLSDSVYSSSTGLLLDGDWLNPTDTSSASGDVFPSGNGRPTGDFEFAFVVLRGDFNGDNVVDFLDLSIISGNYGQSSGAAYTNGDINGDGAVDLIDWDLFGQSYNKDLNTLSIAGDVNGDWVFDKDDEFAFLDLFATGDAIADLNEDGLVDLLDLDRFSALQAAFAGIDLDLRDSVA